MAARRIAESPRAFAELGEKLAALRTDPHSADIVAAWDDAMKEGAIAVARKLAELSPEGEFLRDAGLHALILPLVDIEKAQKVVMQQRALDEVVYSSEPRSGS